MLSIREYTIDLTLTPEDRWACVDPEPVRFCVEQAMHELRTLYAPWMIRAARIAARGLKAWLGNDERVREINGLAAHAGVDAGDLFLLNLSYDLSSCLGGFSRYQGCTGAIVRTSYGVQLARSMDWAFPTGIGAHTTAYRYTDGETTILSVGFPGFIGVVSGINECGLAIALNQAFTPTAPNYALPVPWLIRHLLETETSYAAALTTLTRTPAASAGLYMLADEEHGGLIESTGVEDTVWELDSTHLTVANHFHEDEPPETLEWGDSFSRHEKLNAALCRGTAPKRALCVDEVENGDTAHQLIIHPKGRAIEIRCPGHKKPKWELFQ